MDFHHRCPCLSFRSLSLLTLFLGGVLFGPLIAKDVLSSEISQATLLTRSLAAIDRHYVDSKRVNLRKMLDGGLERIQQLIPEILVRYEGDGFKITVGHATKHFPLTGFNTLSHLRKVFTDILVFIDDNYAGKTDRKEIEYAAIDGMVAALDPHSSFLPPKVFNEFKVGTKGVFGGLGIVIGIRDGALSVISPLDGTPAARAGVRAGDRIIQIDDESTINMSLTDAVNRLRGEVGSKVRLVMERPGRTAPLAILLKRALINIDSVQHAVLVEGEKRIGYLKVKNFQSNTDADVQKALEAFHRTTPPLQGIILDLRNNPGGLLDQSVLLADHFIPDGTIVSTVAAHEKLMDRDDASVHGDEPRSPLVVLMNNGSASASEIVAGALQVHDRALIMGSRTFGKGSVQTIFEVGNDAALKLTIAQYLAGGTKPIQLVGVVPDVELIPAVIDQKEMNLLEDKFTNENDLEQHLERANVAIEKSKIQLTYVAPKESSDEEVIRAKEYARRPDVADDFPVSLAKRIITNTDQPTGSGMLLAAQTLLKTVRDEEQEKTKAALALQGIDWSTVKNEGGKPLLRVAYNIRHKGTPLSEITAGGEATLELIATNVGEGTFSQLIGVSQSETPLLANREFLFGKLPPGATRRSQVPIKIPGGIPTEELDMKVEFLEEHGNIPAPLNIVVPVKEVPGPHFAFTYRLAGTPVGKQLAKAKPLHMMIDVMNLGRGESSAETVATLTNKSGDNVFLRKGRAVLGNLKPGAQKSVTFEFMIEQGFDVPHLELELDIIDPKKTVVVTAPLTIEIARAEIAPTAEKQHQAPTIELSQTSPIKTTEASWQLQGAINDDNGVRDYVIFVADKKINYTPMTQGGTSIPFSVGIPLKPGNNVITIAAHDSEDLLGRRIVVIRRLSTLQHGEHPETTSASTHP